MGKKDKIKKHIPVKKIEKTHGPSKVKTVSVSVTQNPVNSSRFLHLMGRLKTRIVIPVVLFIVIGIICTRSYSTSTESLTKTDKQGDAEKLKVQNEDEHTHIIPTVFIGVLVRNKAHSLPYFLHGFDIQAYPKDRIWLRFQVDNTSDDSWLILSQWIDNARDYYHQIDVEFDENEHGLAYMWSEEHYLHVIHLRQKLLLAARQVWADFLLSIDADVILTNPNTVYHMVDLSQNPQKYQSDLPKILPLVSALLNCTTSEYYANFWGAMTDEGYYKRSDQYFDIQRRYLIGVFPVPMAHTLLLINLRHAKVDRLTYEPAENYNGPVDDIIVFAHSVEKAGLYFYINNRHFYGYVPAPVDINDLDPSDPNVMLHWTLREKELFTHLLMQAVLDQKGSFRLEPSEILRDVTQTQLPEMSKFGLDEIYFINLDRRSDRRITMEYFLALLGVDAKRISAVDGHQLTPELISSLGIRQLEGYADPYHKRSLKYGEIGCFLSHYHLWQEVMEKGLERILILEDDVRFAPGFTRYLMYVIDEADTFQPDWDLLYIGRKRMSSKETRVPGAAYLAYPDYTYWTLGYVIRWSGVKKLLEQNPLKKLIAVDEYLPIMFNRHPQKEWLEKFEPRNLVALSAEPLLIEPQRYTGEQLYVSDTEDSLVLQS